MPKRPSILTCTAGEHYFAYQLSKRGYIVGLTRAGTQSLDLLVSNQKGNKTITIQVKTMDNAFNERKRNPEKSFWGWFIGKKGFEIKGERVLYALIDLQDEIKKEPLVFIVPSKDIINYLGPNPNEWSIPCFRISAKEKNNYLNRWDIIKKLLS